MALAKEPETKDELMDIQGIHNSTNVTDVEQGIDFGHGFYSIKDPWEGFRRALRPILFEDRILPIEQKFFCDRATEKTVTIWVKDNQDTRTIVSNSTVRLSCQHPLSAVYDMTMNNSRNTEQNNLVQLRTDETECLETGCTILRYNDTQDERKGSPWPWDEQYP